MEISFNSLELTPRLFPCGLHVKNIGYLPHKTYGINVDFESYNFSFILKGKGRFESPNQSTEVVAPCVITQSPGTRQNYGPDTEGWTEVFLVYESDTRAELTQRGFWPPPAPLWTVQNTELFQHTTQLLIDRMQLGQCSEQADHLDRLAEQCILASLLPAVSQEDSNSSRNRILSIRHQVDSQLQQVINWGTLAEAAHMSVSTFRRKWLEYIGTPPAAYLTRRRMEEAARLLMTSQLPISEIATHVGYADALHFSRVFRQNYGIAPRNYRKNRQ